MMIVKKLQKARTLKKMIAQRKLTRARKTLERITSPKKGIPIEIREFEGKEAIRVLRNFVKLSKEFVPKEFRKTETGIWLDDLENELKNPDPQSLIALLREGERKGVEHDLRRHLNFWVLKNIDKIEPIIKEELRKEYKEDVDRLIVSTSSSIMKHEKINDYKKSIVPREDVWAYIVSKMGNHILHVGGDPEEIVKKLKRYQRRNKVARNIIKQADKAIELMEKGRDPIFIDALGHDRELELGVVEPEITGAYIPITEDLDHELGHDVEFKKSRQIKPGNKRDSKKDELYNAILSEAIAYMNELRGRDYEKAYSLARGSDLQHAIGWEIARNAEKLGITTKDLLAGLKEPSKFTKELLDKMEKIDRKRAKKLKQELKTSGYL